MELKAGERLFAVEHAARPRDWDGDGAFRLEVQDERGDERRRRVDPRPGRPERQRPRTRRWPSRPSRRRRTPTSRPASIASGSRWTASTTATHPVPLRAGRPGARPRRAAGARARARARRPSPPPRRRRLRPPGRTTRRPRRRRWQRRAAARRRGRRRPGPGARRERAPAPPEARRETRGGARLRRSLLLGAAPAAAQDPGARTPAIGGGSFNAAPLLEPGLYRDTILPDEFLYYGVALQVGQRLHVRARIAEHRRGRVVGGGGGLRDQPVHAAAPAADRPGGRGRRSATATPTSGSVSEDEHGRPAALGLLRAARAAAGRGARGDRLRGAGHLVPLVQPPRDRARASASRSSRSSSTSRSTGRRETEPPDPTPEPTPTPTPGDEDEPAADDGGGAPLGALAALGAVGAGRRARARRRARPPAPALGGPTPGLGPGPREVESRASRAPAPPRGMLPPCAASAFSRPR